MLQLHIAPFDILTPAFVSVDAVTVESATQDSSEVNFGVVLVSGTVAYVAPLHSLLMTT